MDRVRLPLLLFSIGLLLSGCDTFGGGEDDGGDEAEGSSPLAMVWNGTYEGTGQETDYYETLPPNTIVIAPSLTAVVQDSSLAQLELSWSENGESRSAQTTGELNRITPDTLVTPFASVDADSFQVDYQFRLGRDTVATGDSIRVRGILDQQYENTEVDSTLVRFTVFRAAQQ